MKADVFIHAQTQILKIPSGLAKADCCVCLGRNESANYLSHPGTEASHSLDNNYIPTTERQSTIYRNAPTVGRGGDTEPLVLKRNCLRANVKIAG